ncbi:MAG: hypothetical protein RMI56_04480 [Sulfolobales archaeon]|nr:hypothetical protein [Sulfolobales archaeon]
MTLYASMSMAAAAFIYLLGERRIDAYAAVSILTYFTSRAVARPTARAPLAVRALEVALLLVFAAIVIWRIYEVLSR